MELTGAFNSRLVVRPRAAIRNLTQQATHLLLIMNTGPSPILDAITDRLELSLW